MVLLYMVFLLTFVTSVENLIFLFSSYLRENTMCEGVKLLKNKNMSFLIISKENSLSNCVGLNVCAFVYSQLWSKQFWKWHIEDTQSLGKPLSVYQEHQSTLLRIEVMRLQSRTECTPELEKHLLAFTNRVEFLFQSLASWWRPQEKIFSKSISDWYLSNSYSYMETSRWTGISKILKCEHICALKDVHWNTCLEISDELCWSSSQTPAVTIRASCWICFQEISFPTSATTFPGAVQLVINTANNDSFSSRFVPRQAAERLGSLPCGISVWPGTSPLLSASVHL